MKGRFNFQDINLESRHNNGLGNHLALWNIHSDLALWGDLLLLTLGEKNIFNQPVFYYMSSSTLFRLHNNIYFKKFHMDGMVFQTSSHVN
jgi:hypothetical protein